MHISSSLRRLVFSSTKYYRVEVIEDEEIQCLNVRLIILWVLYEKKPAKKPKTLYYIEDLSNYLGLLYFLLALIILFIHLFIWLVNYELSILATTRENYMI